MYQEIPEIDETLFQKQPSQSDSSSSSNDVYKTECEVEVVMEWNGGSSSSLQNSIPSSDDSLNGNEDVSSTPESTVVPGNGRGTRIV